VGRTYRLGFLTPVVAETPVEQPSVFELVVNLQTAKSMGHQASAGDTDRPSRQGYRMIGRRALLSALVLPLLLGPSRAFGQQHRVWRIGFLALPKRPEPIASSRFGAFALGMRELGYVEGENLQIEWRFAESDVGRLAELAAELVRLKVDIIVAGGTPVIRAAQKATAAIPIVMAANNDPVGSGFVESLGRPGGNITGLSNLSTDLSPKIVELLRSLAPKVTHVAVLSNPNNLSNAAVLKNLQAPLQRAGLKILPVDATTPAEISQCFATMRDQGAGAVIVAPDTMFVEQRALIADLALANQMPSIFSFREHVEAGGLLSYGEHLADSYHRAAIYVDRIFKGAKPGDLPVEQSAKLELFIHRGTAKTLGLVIPPDVIALANDVVE
jgi:putative tryptophan/tyrosine transport system substrate-binding protein